MVKFFHETDYGLLRAESSLAVGFSAMVLF